MKKPSLEIATGAVKGALDGLAGAGVGLVGRGVFDKKLKKDEDLTLKDKIIRNAPKIGLLAGMAFGARKIPRFLAIKKRVRSKKSYYKPYGEYRFSGDDFKKQYDDFRKKYQQGGSRYQQGTAFGKNFSGGEYFTSDMIGKAKTKRELKHFFIQKAKKLHPDAGGNDMAMQKLNKEWESVRNSPFFQKLAFNRGFFKQLIRSINNERL